MSRESSHPHDNRTVGFKSTLSGFPCRRGSGEVSAVAVPLGEDHIVFSSPDDPKAHIWLYALLYGGRFE